MNLDLESLIFAFMDMKIKEIVSIFNKLGRKFNDNLVSV